ncbi:MAG TPA: 2,3-bisphosphoglycerate-independent phosphoglycerate mutase, partial [bacterium]|nr:2,3-bisphosphoglycerate-independent phosphoglycerate mutase [bacterium]
MPSLTPRRPVCLVILDGVGYRTDPAGNAVLAADTPFLDQAFAQFPWVLLEPGGEAVGLPPGQMGNSEVG